MIYVFLTLVDDESTSVRPQSVVEWDDNHGIAVEPLLRQDPFGTVYTVNSHVRSWMQTWTWY